jgi:hypothetical protein
LDDLDEHLDAAVQAAYGIFTELDFRKRRATVCPCCVNEQTALELARTPRRDLSSDLIRAYLGSAHHVDEGSAAAEVRHFLPRIFELLTYGFEVSGSGNECALIRLGRGALGWGEKTYRDVWTARQIAAVDRFLHALWRRTLSKQPKLFLRPDGGPWLFEDDDAERLLCMVATAGGEIVPLLAIWEDDSSASASLHIAALVSRATCREWRPFALMEEGGLGDPHWERFQPEMRSVVDWLVDPRRRDRMFEAFMAADQDSPEAIVLAEAHDELDRILALRRLH